MLCIYICSFSPLFLYFQLRIAALYEPNDECWPISLRECHFFFSDFQQLQKSSCSCTKFMSQVHEILIHENKPISNQSIKICTHCHECNVALDTGVPMNTMTTSHVQYIEFRSSMMNRFPRHIALFQLQILHVVASFGCRKMTNVE